MQVENSFLRNEGGCRDAHPENKRSKKMPTLRQEVIDNPISTSLFLSDMHCSVLCRYLTYNLRTNGNTFEVNCASTGILKTKM